MPVFFLIMIFTIWLCYELKKGSRQSKKDSEEFWARERSSWTVPRQSTDDINFVTVPASSIPEKLPGDSEELKAAIDGLNALVGIKVADLSMYTNTELRHKYGTANFNELSEADTSYTTLVNLVPKCITLLREEGRSAEAEQLLLLGQACNIKTKAFKALLEGIVK